MFRTLALLISLSFMAGCATTNQVDSPPADLGAFSLGHNVVIADKMQKVPISRDATQQEWVDALSQAIEARFGRYEGDQLYHLGVSVEGFALAPPGVPLVATPKSVLAINVTVWDDAAGKKINEEVKQLVIFEAIGDSFLLGSGLTNTREEQLENLAFNAAREIERWMSSQHRAEGWFASKDAPAATALDAAEVVAE
jgi:hypothetical protein